MTAGMMFLILGIIVAAVIAFAVVAWQPWDDGDGSTNITNNPVPAQNNDSGGNNSGGGSNNNSGGSNSGGSNSGGSGSGGSSSGSGGSSSR
jgi:hypothetical protein